MDANGTPLALLPEFESEPDAMFLLWKDHTAIDEASHITQHARTWGGEDFTRFVGGTYSSEWFWAKVWHVLKTNPAVASTASHWAEHCDWIPALLSGNTEPSTWMRSRCAMGHKALWHASWGGLPPEAFWKGLDPKLLGVVQSMPQACHPSDALAGRLSETWAKKLGLEVGLPIAVGAFDCHMGAVGAGIRPGDMVKVIGTSTCDITVSSPQALGDRCIDGICGQVDGSVLPDLVGLEAGQSAFGDLYAWWTKLLLGPSLTMIDDSDLHGGEKEKLKEQFRQQIILRLNEQAMALPTEPQVVAVDWMNGRRTPHADASVKGCIGQLGFGSDAASVFKALVEATAYGARAIQECFESQGVNIERVLAIGGIPHKSPLVVQTLADVLNRPIAVVESQQCCALGAAIFASTAAGVYGNASLAVEAMASPINRVVEPREDWVSVFAEGYAEYQRWGATSNTKESA